LSGSGGVTAYTPVLKGFVVRRNGNNKNKNKNKNNNGITMVVNNNDVIINRANFLSSTTTAAAVTFTSASAGFVTANTNPEECAAAAAAAANSFNNNPRYIERELDMIWSEGGNKEPRSKGMLVRRITGDSTPYLFPVIPIRLVKEWPMSIAPFHDEDFFRSDSNDDGWFYKVPRLTYHIDEPSVASLTQYYRSKYANIKSKSDILDICSSWVSHYPLEFPLKMNKIYATGMSKLELQLNDQLSKDDESYKATDLNVDPTLPYRDESFDVVTCCVSIEYLIEPIKVLKECHRILRPGGKVIISQSNRCFPSKTIAMVRTYRTCVYIPVPYMHGEL
jgi:SAM-dependent methyltransferase